jgi:hypothetical protein
MSDARRELSEHGHLAGHQRAARRGTITERYYAMPLLQQYIRWEEMTEFLNGLEAICRQAQRRRDEHLPPERRLRWR